MIDIVDFKKIPITDYLTAIGHPFKIRGRYAYACASIVREGADHPEHLAVHIQSNLWRDVVAGKGGSIIDLVMAHRRMDYVSAIKFLAEWKGQLGENGVSQRHSLPSNRPNESFSPRVTAVEPIHRPMWREYLSGRCIDPDACRGVLYEVAFDLPGRSINHYCGLGWQGRNGGWHIRTKMDRLPKLSTSPADITYLPLKTCEICVFEGIMDYLSFVSHWSLRRAVIVLNSCVRAEAAISLIKEQGYSRCHLYLDNDEAGDFATDLFAAKLGADAVTDHRAPYQRLCLNDVNDYVAHLKCQ